MNIILYNPSHDGAIAYLKGAQLLVSIEAEKNSNYRYSPISSHDVFNVLGALVHNSRSRSIIALHPEIRGPA